MTTTGRCVLVVDDHPVFRRGIRALLEGEEWVGEVFEAETVAEAVKKAAIHHVDVVVMDIRLGDDDRAGIEATRRIVRVRPEARVLMLTMTPDQDVVITAVRAGARGYVHKGDPPGVLLDSLRTVAGGGLAMGPGVSTDLLTSIRRAPPPLPPPLDRLTARELDILSRIVNGDSNALIAGRVGVSEKTIRNQLSMMYSKLGVADRVQAALVARNAGIGL